MYNLHLRGSLMIKNYSVCLKAGNFGDFNHIFTVGYLWWLLYLFKHGHVECGRECTILVTARSCTLASWPVGDKTQDNSCLFMWHQSISHPSSVGIIDQAAALPDGCDSICSFCSRMKRGRLYACARREGYNVLAMGQHLDDLTER